MMKTYKQKMIDYLELDGWDISRIEEDGLEWWADEIWHLKSNWSPEGATVFLTFLVDPQHEGIRDKGQNVLGVGCSKNYPKSRVEAECCGTIEFGKSFKKDILDFQVKMESLRVR